MTGQPNPFDSLRFIEPYAPPDAEIDPQIGASGFSVPTWRLTSGRLVVMPWLLTDYFLERHHAGYLGFQSVHSEPLRPLPELLSRTFELEEHLHALTDLTFAEAKVLCAVLGGRLPGLGEAEHILTRGNPHLGDSPPAVWTVTAWSPIYRQLGVLRALLGGLSLPMSAAQQAADAEGRHIVLRSDANDQDLLCGWSRAREGPGRPSEFSSWIVFDRQ